MSNKITKILVWVLIIIIFLSFLSFSIFNIYANYALYIPLIIFIPLTILNFNKIKNNDKKNLFNLTLLIAVSIILNFGSLKSTLTYLIFGLGIINFSNYKFSKFEMKVLKTLLIGLVAMTLFRVYNFNKVGYSKTDLAFNPNTLGQLLLYSSIMLTIIYEKMKSSTLLLVITNVIIFIGIIFSESRASLLGFLFFTFLYSISKKVNISKKTISKLLLIIVIIGTTFPFLYLEMYKRGVEFNIPFTDKPLWTGREFIWMEAINQMENKNGSLIFGLGNKIVLSNGDEFSVHNVYFSIIVKSGIIIYFLFFKFLLENNKNKSKVISFGLMAILINGYFETSFLWEMTFIFPMLIIGYNVKEVENDE